MGRIQLIREECNLISTCRKCFSGKRQGICDSFNMLYFWFSLPHCFFCKECRLLFYHL